MHRLLVTLISAAVLVTPGVATAASSVVDAYSSTPGLVDLMPAAEQASSANAAAVQYGGPQEGPPLGEVSSTSRAPSAQQGSPWTPAAAATPAASTPFPTRAQGQVAGQTSSSDHSTPDMAAVGGADAPDVALAREARLLGDSSAGSLPFTGLDVLLITIGGMALLGVGFSLRHAARTTFP